MCIRDSPHPVSAPASQQPASHSSQAHRQTSRHTERPPDRHRPTWSSANSAAAATVRPTWRDASARARGSAQLAYSHAPAPSGAETQRPSCQTRTAWSCASV
eukprot:1750441-Rhodomonas_salina.5